MLVRSYGAHIQAKISFPQDIEWRLKFLRSQKPFFKFQNDNKYCSIEEDVMAKNTQTRN
jgi:hypothetical protein